MGIEDMVYFVLLVLLWAAFYASHSLLASVKVKRKLELKWSSRMKWYRLSYSIFSLLFILLILWFSMRMPFIQLFPNSPFGTYLGYMLATFGTILLVKSSKSISVRKFVGIQPENDKNLNLVVEGLYGQVRHPLYVGLLLIFLGYFFISPTLVVLIHTLCLVVYLPIGIHYEEKNLISIFGEKYRNYQLNVPAFFPRLGIKKGA